MFPNVNKVAQINSGHHLNNQQLNDSMQPNIVLLISIIISEECFSLDLNFPHIEVFMLLQFFLKS